MAEEENIVRELHGHFDQALRTALSGGLQFTEQRSRRRQHEAEAERLRAQEAARQLEERKRVEHEAAALLAQQSIAAEEALRETAAHQAGESATASAPTAYPSTIEDALEQARRNSVDRPGEHTAKTHHQRERGAVRPPAELGR
jgi:prophage DNA circulation protein